MIQVTWRRSPVCSLPNWKRGEIDAAKYLVSSRGNPRDFFAGQIVCHCENRRVSCEKGALPHEKRDN
jgi:hypothetical protein